MGTLTDGVIQLLQTAVYAGCMCANIMQYMREVTEGREGWGFVEYNRPTIAYICLLDADAKLPII
jgi:hypothetical protein